MGSFRAYRVLGFRAWFRVQGLGKTLNPKP